jgi:hypothetical protein
MTKILVLYYSMYGHIEIMAKAVTEGVRSANADVVIKRVPDTMSPEVAKQYGAKLTPFLRRWILARCVGAVPTVPEQLRLLMVLACLAPRN